MPLCDIRIEQASYFLSWLRQMEWPNDHSGNLALFLSLDQCTESNVIVTSLERA